MRQGQKPMGLVADIGGTNGRFALVASSGEIFEQRQYLCADFKNFAALVTRYLDDSGAREPLCAVIAVAGPPEGNSCTLTNGAWSIDGARLVESGLVDSCLLVNDFTALAASLPALQDKDLLRIGPPVTSIAGSRLVVGPGTGLGAAYLAHIGSNYIPLDGEGGHVSFAPVDEQETALLAWFGKKYGRVSVERILSGQGLVDLHVALTHIHDRRVDRLTAGQIMTQGLAGAGFERDTLLQFCAILGSFAGDLALAGGCRGGVYIGGGIAPRMPQLLVDSPFRARFEAKGRFAKTMKSVPSWLITHKTPALLGAVSFL